MYSSSASSYVSTQISNGICLLEGYKLHTKLAIGLTKPFLTAGLTDLPVLDDTPLEALDVQTQ